MPVSLKSRLNLGLLVSLLLVFILQWLLVVRAIRGIAEDYVAARLAHDADQIVAALAFEADGAMRLPAGETGLIYQQPYSGHYYRIDGDSQALRSRSLWDVDLPERRLPPGQTARQRLTGPQHQALLVFSRGYSKQGHGLTISVAEDLGGIDDDLARFAARYAGLSAVMALLLIFIQTGLTGIVLRPFKRMRVELRQLEQGARTTLDVPAEREIGPVVAQLNRVLETHRAQLARSRKAAGNLAHAMKTPLATLAGLIDRNAVRADPELETALRRQTATLNSLVERELKRARLAGSPGGGQHTELAEEVPRLVEVLNALYGKDKALTIDYQLPSTTRLPLDREDLLELLGNLLDNACKWARARVRLRLVSDKDLIITVEDDGPGLAPEVRPRLTARGARADETVHGHGLGLAIVTDIVEAYQGRLEFGDSIALGGLQVEVMLPLPPA